VQNITTIDFLMKHSKTRLCFYATRGRFTTNMNERVQGSYYDIKFKLHLIEFYRTKWCHQMRSL